MAKKDSVTINKVGPHVHYVEILSGKCPANSLVQVFVWSNDKKWYLQKTAFVNGTDWNCMVFFGFEDSPSKSKYTVTAAVCDRPTVGSMPSLPESKAKSRAVRVIRK